MAEFLIITVAPEDGMLWKALTAAGLVLVAAPAPAAPPAWCSSEALNASERIICVDGILSRLDFELTDAYEAARRVAPNLDQTGWLAERDSCGTDVSCLERVYRSRITELHDIALGPSAPVPGEARAGDAWWEGREDTDGQAWDKNRVRTSELYGGDQYTSDGVVAVLGEALGGLVSRNLLPALDGMTPRPWCNAGRLNATERTICDDLDLSRLDALLELVYGRANARDDDRAQNSWLRSERDVCGTDRLCIAEAYAGRIQELDDASSDVAEPSRNLDIPAGHYPPPGSCRVWYPGLPPGQQPPPSSCDVRVPEGAVLLGRR